MNLADSMKSVLKNKSNIFTDFWKEDLKMILSEVGEDFMRLFKNSNASVKQLRNTKLKVSAKEAFESGADFLIILKLLPSRIREGFTYFRSDLIDELEKFPDQKHKTIFSLKVLGALTSFTIGSIYSLKKGTADFSLKGLRRKNAFTQFIVAEIIFRVSQVFLQRFLDEVEKEVTEPEDLKNLRYFKGLLLQRSKAEDGSHENVPEHGDRSIQIVENLKKYIMTGKRDLE
jgi:dsDNA-binding SOS-regulon protein